MDFNFEKQMSAIQADMVSVGLEYCENKCEKVFVHLIIRYGNAFVDFFFRTKGKMIRKNEIEFTESFDTIARQREALSIIMTGTNDFIELCKSNSKPIPTELKLIYDVASQNFKADYSYDKPFSEDKSNRAISEEWFCQIKGDS